MLKTFMLTTGVLLMLTAAAVLPVPALYAQQAPSQQAEDVQQDSDGDSDETPAADGQANEQTETDLPDIDNQPIQPGSGGPGRFIPSEQISQDLGVSFPVDI